MTTIDLREKPRDVMRLKMYARGTYRIIEEIHKTNPERFKITWEFGYTTKTIARARSFKEALTFLWNRGCFNE